MSDLVMLYRMVLATYAKAAGLGHDECDRLWEILAHKDNPGSVREAYEQLDDATQHIRRHREVEDW